MDYSDKVLYIPKVDKQNNVIGLQEYLQEQQKRGWVSLWMLIVHLFFIMYAWVSNNFTTFMLNFVCFSWFLVSSIRTSWLLMFLSGVVCILNIILR